MIPTNEDGTIIPAETMCAAGDTAANTGAHCCQQYADLTGFSVDEVRRVGSCGCVQAKKALEKERVLNDELVRQVKALRVELEDLRAGVIPGAHGANVLIDTLRDEVERMRDVVEAAVYLVGEWRAGSSDWYDEVPLADAVDAYRNSKAQA